MERREPAHQGREEQRRAGADSGTTHSAGGSRRSRAGVTTSYTYDGRHRARDTGQHDAKYVHGPGIDEPLAADDGAALDLLPRRRPGSSSKVTNAAGAVTLTRQYDAWGNLEAGASEPGYAFTGREWDPRRGSTTTGRDTTSKGREFPQRRSDRISRQQQLLQLRCGQPCRAAGSILGCRHVRRGGRMCPRSRVGYQERIFGPVRQVNPCKEAGGLEVLPAH